MKKWKLRETKTCRRREEKYTEKERGQSLKRGKRESGDEIEGNKKKGKEMRFIISSCDEKLNGEIIKEASDDYYYYKLY